MVSPGFYGSSSSGPLGRQRGSVTISSLGRRCNAANRATSEHHRVNTISDNHGCVKSRSPGPPPRPPLPRSSLLSHRSFCAHFRTNRLGFSCSLVTAIGRPARATRNCGVNRTADDTNPPLELTYPYGLATGWFLGRSPQYFPHHYTSIPPFQ
jgi:hypothetical protein